MKVEGVWGHGVWEDGEMGDGRWADSEDDRIPSRARVRDSELGKVCNGSMFGARCSMLAVRRRLHVHLVGCEMMDNTASVCEAISLEAQGD